MCCLGNTRNRSLNGARPNSDNLAWKFSGVVNYGGRKMNFDSRFWYKRAIEMRSIASETKNPQSKETMLGIAHDYDLLGHQFEYREKCALRDVIRKPPRVPAGTSWSAGFKQGASHCAAGCGCAAYPQGGLRGRARLR